LEQEGNPEMLALVPVTGPSHSSIKRRTRVLFGQRNAMRPVPAVNFEPECAAPRVTTQRQSTRPERLRKSQEFPRRLPCEQNGLFD